MVLYELLTGERPFKGDYEQAIIYSVLNEEPEALGVLRPEVPEALAGVVAQLLQKDPEARYQTAEDVAADLKHHRETALQGGAEVRPRAISTKSPQRIVKGSRPWFAVAATALLVLLLVLGYLFLRPEETVQTAPRLTRPSQITNAVGPEDFPTWSPDGGSLAYASNQDGDWDIWIAQLSGGPPLNRTQDYDGVDWYPSWSPDGSQLAFWSEREDRGYFVMPALAGAPQKVIHAPMWRQSASPPLWSSDGSQLACVVQDSTGTSVRIVSLPTRTMQQVPLPVGKGNAALDVSWSPDGRFFAYVDAWDASAQVTQIRILRIADGVDFLVTDGMTNVWSPSWSKDGRTLYFISNRGGSMDLWQQRIGEDGALERAPWSLTTGVGMRHAIFSPDGSKLAYSKGQPVANLWRVPILADRPATWADAQQVTFDQADIEGVDVSPDGKQLLLSSDRGGNMDVWVMPVEGGEMQQLTTDLAPDWGSYWSPDGQEIVFYSYRTGNRDVWVMPVGEGPLRQLTQDEAQDATGAWSPDGQEIAFFSGRKGNMDLWVIPSQGGEARQVTRHPARDVEPQWSPDGTWLLFSSDRTGDFRLWRVSAQGGTPAPLTQGSAMISRWSLDRKTIYFTGWGEQAGNLWVVSADGSHERPVTDFTGRRGSIGWALATDGQYLYFTWEVDIGDLWVMDVAWSEE